MERNDCRLGLMRGCATSRLLLENRLLSAISFIHLLVGGLSFRCPVVAAPELHLFIAHRTENPVRRADPTVYFRCPLLHDLAAVRVTN